MDIEEDNELFKRIGLIKHRSLLLSMDKQSFRDCFNSNVSDDADLLGRSSHHKHFHGRIRALTFDLAQPRRYFDHSSMAIAKGMYEEVGHQLKVQLVAFIPLNTAFIYFIIWLAQAIAIISFMISSNGIPLIIQLGIGVVFFAFGSMLFLHFRRAVVTMMNDVEREMGYWIAKMNALQQQL